MADRIQAYGKTGAGVHPDLRGQADLKGAALNGFDGALAKAGLYPLRADGVSVFQVNMGRVCNQACRHCHVSAAPDRAEAMSESVADECLSVIEANRFAVVDITGGAPEMNPSYRRFLSRAVASGSHVKTRTNLTVLLDEGFDDLPGLWAEKRVEVVASLPYYLKETVDRQRGQGVFDRSIEAIKRLNAAGYGASGSGLSLDLVYNPCGAYLPPVQRSIEADFRRELAKRHGVVFTGLFTITNMPVGRFRDFLESSGNLVRYMGRLTDLFNPEAARNVMCRTTISVGHDGTLYDCDFNQMLGLKCGFGAPDQISRFDVSALARRRIVTGTHCYGCTAGAGSSCTGAVA